MSRKTLKQQAKNMVIPSIDVALSAIPNQFRYRLIKRYLGLKSAYLEGKHDACGVRAGRFSEVLLRFLQHHLTGTHIPFGTHISQFDEECRKLERTPKTAGPEGLRILIPRVLNTLYTFRNKRGIGHEGGDVDANEIDAVACVRLADWCLCELIRVFHALSLKEAQQIVDNMAEKEVPEVWSVGNKKRVLDASLEYPSQTLVLLYADSRQSIPVRELFDWTDHSNLTVYKRDVLRRLHSRRLIEYDSKAQTVTISPLGIKEVEDNIRPRMRSGSI
jgi:hypothetical protein